jgi:hypothetical protein
MPGSLVPAADLAPTLIFHRYAAGFYTRDEEGRMESSKGLGVQNRHTVPFLDLWTKEWPGDEHFAMYGAMDGDEQIHEMPRFTKPGLANALGVTNPKTGEFVIEPLISRAFAGCFALDLDLPGHGASPWDEQTRTAMQVRFHEAAEIEPLLMTPTVFYTSAGGLRLVYAFKNSDVALYGDEGLEDIIAGMIGAGAAAGLVFDPACRDWTRLFRLPRVVREQTPAAYASTWLQHYFRISYGTVDMTAQEEAPKQLLAFDRGDFPCASLLDPEWVSQSPEGKQLITTDNTWKQIFGSPARGASGVGEIVNIGPQPSKADLPELLKSKPADWIKSHLKKRQDTQTVTTLETILYRYITDPISIYPERDITKGFHNGMICMFGRFCTWALRQTRILTIEDIYAVAVVLCHKANEARQMAGHRGYRADYDALNVEIWNLLCHCWRLQTAAKQAELESSEAEVKYKLHLQTELKKQNDNIQNIFIDTMCKWLPSMPRERVVEMLPTAMIIAVAKSMHTLCVTTTGVVRYSNGADDVPELGTFVRDSGHSLVNLHKINDRGEQQFKSKAEILYEGGIKIDERRLSRLIDGNCLKEEYGNLVFMRKCHGVRKDIKPMHDERVHRWLKALGGNNPHGLMSWLAGFHRLERPMAALIIHGDPGIGKGMLLEALQSCTEARLWAPFSQCMEQFQDDFEMTPLIVADERADGGSKDRDQSLINTFKKLVTGEFKSLNIKHLRRITIEGNWRVVVLGNNAEQLIRFKEDVNDKDLDAFAVRSLYIDSNGDACRKLLEEFGGRTGTDGWPEHVIPQHIEWLRHNYKFEEGKRLLVEGTITRFHENLRVNSGSSHVAVTALGRILNDVESMLLKTPDRNKALFMVEKTLANAGIYIRRDDGHLTTAKMVVQPSKLRERMVDLFKDDKSMTVPPLGSVLQSLKFLSVDPTAKNDSATYKFNNPETNKGVKDVRGICINTKLLVTTLYKTYDPFDFEHTLGPVLWARSKPDQATRQDMEASKTDTAGESVRIQDTKFTLNKRAK